MRIADVYVAVKGDLSDFRRSMSELNTNVSAASSKIGATLATVGAGMQRVGSSLTTNVTLPILAVGGATAKMALDFDRALTQVVSLTDITAEEIGGVREAILELSTAIGKSPTELAESFYFLASAGFNATESMEVLELAASAAAAGLGETQVVAQTIGAVVNAYGKENITAARATDILVAAIGEGTAEAPEFAASIGQVVGSAAQIGATFQDVTAAIAAMTLQGLDASEATVSLNQAFVTLFSPTTEAKEALDGYGLSAAGLRDMIKNEGLLPTLGLLAEKFDGNAEATAAVFGNVRALRAILALTGPAAENTAQVFQDVADSTGSLKEAVETYLASPAAKLNRSLAELQVVAIQLGEDVLPVVVDILHEVAAVAKVVATWWGTLSDDTKKSIVQWGLLLAVIGPVVKVVGLLSSALGGVLKAVGFLTGAKGIPRLITQFGGLTSVAKSFLGLGIAAAIWEIGGATADWVATATQGEDAGDAFARLRDEMGPLATATNEVNYAFSGLREISEAFDVPLDQLVTRFLELRESGMNWADALKEIGRTMSPQAQALEESGSAWEEYQNQITGATTEMREAAYIAEGVPPEIAAALAAGAPAVGAAADLSAEEIAQAMEQARADAVAAMQGMIADLATTLATGPDEIADEMAALQEALLNPYTDTRRRIDLEGALASTAFGDALASGDSRLEADAFTRVNALLAQYELIAPGAVAAGELVNPALQSGIDSNLNAMLAWVAENVAAPYLDTMELDEALYELGYTGLAEYAHGLAVAEQQRLAAERAEIRRQTLEDFNMSDGTSTLGYEAGVALAGGLSSSSGQVGASARGVNVTARNALGDQTGVYGGGLAIGGTWINGIVDAIYAGMYAMRIATNTIRNELGHSLPTAGPLKGDTAGRGGRSIGALFSRELAAAIIPPDLSNVARAMTMQPTTIDPLRANATIVQAGREPPVDLSGVEALQERIDGIQLVVPPADLSQVEGPLDELQRLISGIQLVIPPISAPSLSADGLEAQLGALAERVSGLELVIPPIGTGGLDALREQVDGITLRVPPIDVPPVDVSGVDVSGLAALQQRISGLELVVPPIEVSGADDPIAALQDRVSRMALAVPSADLSGLEGPLLALQERISGIELTIPPVGASTLDAGSLEDRLSALRDRIRSIQLTVPPVEVPPLRAGGLEGQLADLQERVTGLRLVVPPAEVGGVEGPLGTLQERLGGIQLVIPPVKVPPLGAGGLGDQLRALQERVNGIELVLPPVVPPTLGTLQEIDASALDVLQESISGIKLAVPPIDPPTLETAGLEAQFGALQDRVNGIQLTVPPLVPVLGVGNFENQVEALQERIGGVQLAMPLVEIPPLSVGGLEDQIGALQARIDGIQFAFPPIDASGIDGPLGVLQSRLGGIELTVPPVDLSGVVDPIEALHDRVSGITLGIPPVTLDEVGGSLSALQDRVSGLQLIIPPVTIPELRAGSLEERLGALQERVSGIQLAIPPVDLSGINGPIALLQERIDGIQLAIPPISTPALSTDGLEAQFEALGERVSGLKLVVPPIGVGNLNALQEQISGIKLRVPPIDMSRVTNPLVGLQERIADTALPVDLSDLDGSLDALQERINGIELVVPPVSVPSLSAGSLEDQISALQEQVNGIQLVIPSVEVPSLGAGGLEEQAGTLQEWISDIALVVPPIQVPPLGVGSLEEQMAALREQVNGITLTVPLVDMSGMEGPLAAFEERVAGIELVVPPVQLPPLGADGLETQVAALQERIASIHLVIPPVSEPMLSVDNLEDSGAVQDRARMPERQTPDLQARDSSVAHDLRSLIGDIVKTISQMSGTLGTALAPSFPSSPLAVSAMGGVSGGGYEVTPTLPAAVGGGNTYHVSLLDRLEVRTVEDIGSGLKQLGEHGKLPGSKA